MKGSLRSAWRDSSLSVSSSSASEAISRLCRSIAGAAASDTHSSLDAVMSSHNASRLEWVPDAAAPAIDLQSREIASEAELEDTLNELSLQAERNEPFIVEVRRGSASLGMGLGLPRTVLAFKSSDEPPYYESASDKGEPGNDVVAFYYQGQWTEFPKTALVTKESAVEAMKAFLRTGTRPDNVRW